MPNTPIVLNAWNLPSPIRHDVIFRVVAALPVHQSMTLINDHGPKPLFYPLDAKHPGMYRHDPIDPPSPDQFAVVITRQPQPGDIAVV